jgi:hypothetical protein
MATIEHRRTVRVSRLVCLKKSMKTCWTGRGVFSERPAVDPEIAAVGILSKDHQVSLTPQLAARLPLDVRHPGVFMERGLEEVRP